MNKWLNEWMNEWTKEWMTKSIWVSQKFKFIWKKLVSVIFEPADCQLAASSPTTRSKAHFLPKFSVNVNGLWSQKLENQKPLTLSMILKGKTERY